MANSLHQSIIKCYYQQMWNKFDKSFFTGLLVAEFKLQGDLGRTTNGHEEFSVHMDFVQAAFSDFRSTVVEIISESNKSFARVSHKGIHQGEIFGIAPTNKKIEYTATAVFTFTQDKVLELWVLDDIHELINQLSI